MNPNIEIDAMEFGQHVRNGGWHLGLLVARNVKNEYGMSGKPWEEDGISQATWYRRKKEEIRENPIKISARGFARQAGGAISSGTVSKYLKAWNMAAADELVPLSSDLSPGEQLHFTGQHTAKSWNHYFKPPKERTNEDITELPDFVYRVYDGDGVLLYVGETVDPKERIAKHAINSEWYPLARHWTWTMYQNVPIAKFMESEAIIKENPVYNKVGVRR